MTKQNDIPEPNTGQLKEAIEAVCKYDCLDPYQSPLAMHRARIVKAAKLWMEQITRADKPADNGGGIDALRFSFEEWCKGRHSLRRDEETGEYLEPRTHFAWEAWQGCSRNLLKSEGVCVHYPYGITEEVIHAQYNRTKELMDRIDIQCRHVGHPVGGLDEILMILTSFKNLAIRPFLPAEKE